MKMVLLPISFVPKVQLLLVYSMHKCLGSLPKIEIWEKKNLNFSIFNINLNINDVIDVDINDSSSTFSPPAYSFVSSIPSNFLTSSSFGPSTPNSNFVPSSSSKLHPPIQLTLPSSVYCPSAPSALSTPFNQHPMTIEEERQTYNDLCGLDQESNQ
jgi:hypothetical protein